MYLRAQVLDLMAYLRVFLYVMLDVPVCLRAFAFGVLTCLSAYHACLFYVLHACCAQYLTCWRACVPQCPGLSYLLYICKVKFQKFLYRKICFHLEKNLDPTWISMMELFGEKIIPYRSLNILAKKLHNGYSTGL